MYVVAESNYLDAVSDTLGDLTGLIVQFNGQRARRIDRFIELSLAGALTCRGHRQLQDNTSLVIATGCGTVSTMAAIMETVFRKQHPPKPLHFINSLGNSACFHVARAMEISGDSAAITQGEYSFESALTHAQTQLQCGVAETVLIGGVDEAPLPIAHQRVRLNIGERYSHCYEGSHWLLLSTTAPNAEPSVFIHAPEYIDCEAELLERIQQHKQAKRYYNYIPGFETGGDESDCYLPQPHVYPHRTFSGNCVARASLELRDLPAGSTALVISRDVQENSFCITLLEKQ